MWVRVVGLAAVPLLLLGAAAARSAGSNPPRTIDVTIHFSHFDTDRIEVRPGETVRFVIRNTDPIDHEFIVGDAFVQRVHELGTEPAHGTKPGEVSVPAGTTAETTYTFPTAERATDGPLEFACHLPGHYAYGMHGVIVIA